MFQFGESGSQHENAESDQNILEKTKERTGDKDLLEKTDIEDFLQEHEKKLQGNDVAQKDLEELRGKLDIVEKADADLQSFAELLLRVEKYQSQESEKRNGLGLTEKQSQDVFNNFEPKIDGYRSGEWHEWNKEFLQILGKEGLSEVQAMDEVRKIQEELGVKVDGKIGPITADAMLLHINPEYKIQKEERIQQKVNEILNKAQSGGFERGTLNEGFENSVLANLSGDEVVALRSKVGISGIEELFGLNRGLDLRGKDSDENYQENIESYSDWIDGVAEKYEVNPDYIKSIMYIESRGRFDASSGTGSFGSMQLTQWIYGKNKYGPAVNPFNPQQALDRGVQFFADLNQKYNGDLKKVATAYNQGEPVVDKSIREYGLDWHSHLPTDEGKKYYGHFYEALNTKPWNKKEEE